MPGYWSDERTGQTGVPRACCGPGPARPINRSGGHAQMSSGLESQGSFHAEAGYTYASVAVPLPLRYALTSRAGPCTVHTTFIHPISRTRRYYALTHTTSVPMLCGLI